MPVIAQSRRLRLKISLASSGLVHCHHRFWTHRRFEEVFREYLPILYSSVRATVPLLREAAAQARARSGTDHVAKLLLPYYERHAEEELHHDVWLLQDIQACGLPRDEVLRRVPPPEIAAMIGAQYYWIRHAHPIALLGCFAVLEGDPPRRSTLDTVLARTAIPPQALRTYYKHADLDPEHGRDLDELLDRLPLSPEHEELLGLSAFHTIDQLGRLLRGLLSDFPPVRRTAPRWRKAPARPRVAAAGVSP